MQKKLFAAAALSVFLSAPAGTQEAEGFRIELHNRASEGRAIVLIKGTRAVSLAPGDYWWYEVSDPKQSSFGEHPGDITFMMCAKVKFQFVYPPAWAMDRKIAGKYAITDAFFQENPMTLELVARRANILRYLKTKGRSEHDLELMAHQLREWVLRNHALDIGCTDSVELKTILDWTAVSRRQISVTGSHKSGYAITVE